MLDARKASTIDVIVPSALEPAGHVNTVMCPALLRARGRHIDTEHFPHGAAHQIDHLLYA
jgi:hypothetical protein